MKQPIDAFVLPAAAKRKGCSPNRRGRSGDLAAPRIAGPDRPSADACGSGRLSRRRCKARGEAAYDAAVDRLLASPRYGERMAMDWLDVARYADTHGFNNDSARSMWRWRDWVIDAFNAQHAVQPVPDRATGRRSAAEPHA